MWAAPHNDIDTVAGWGEEMVEPLAVAVWRFLETGLERERRLIMPDRARRWQVETQTTFALSDKHVA